MSVVKCSQEGRGVRGGGVVVLCSSTVVQLLEVCMDHSEHSLFKILLQETVHLRLHETVSSSD